MPVQPVSLGNRSNAGRDGAISAAKLINCYPEDAGPEGKIRLPLVASDGFQIFATASGAGTGVIRAALALTDTALYFVCGTKVIKSDASGTLTTLAGADGLTAIGTLTIDANPIKFKTTTTTSYSISGTPYTKAATTALTFSAAHVVSASKYGIILIQINAAGTISTKVPLTPQIYTSSDDALSDLPSPDSGNVMVGYITIAATSTAWTANTSNMTNGSGLTTAGFTDSTANVVSSVNASGFVTMVRNRAAVPQIGIATSSGHFYVVQNDGLTEVDLTPLGSSTLTSVAMTDGYFVLFFDNGEFFVSGIDQAVFDPLNFAKAEANPDGGKRVIVRGRDVILAGPKSLEGWADTGAADFPLERSGSSDIGCYAAASMVALIDVAGGQTVDTVIWAGSNSDGSYAGVMTLSNGLSGTKISTLEIDRAIEAVSDPTTIRAFTWARGGHVFYCITDGATFTETYDTTTQFWHTRKSDGASLAFWRILGSVILGSKVLVWDYTLSKLYWMKDGLYDASNSTVVTLKHSNDNGNTFPITRTATLSDATNLLQRTKIMCLGQSKEDGKVFQISLSSAVMEDTVANSMVVQPPAVHAWPNPMRFAGIYIDTVPGGSKTSRTKALTGLAVDAVTVHG